MFPRHSGARLQCISTSGIAHVLGSIRDVSPHIQSLARWDDKCAVGIFELHRANIRIDSHLTSQGLYDAADILYGRALAGSKKLLDPEHPVTLQVMANLANVYNAQGQYWQRHCIDEHWPAARNFLGLKHPDTLLTTNSLAVTYQSQGRCGEAEKLYRRVLTGKEKLLGPEHPDILRTVQHEEAIRLRSRYPLATASQVIPNWP